MYVKDWRNQAKTLVYFRQPGIVKLRESGASGGSVIQLASSSGENHACSHCFFSGKRVTISVNKS